MPRGARYPQCPSRPPTLLNPKMLLSSLVTLALASLSMASRVPVRVRPIVHESRRSAPRGWTPIRRAEHDVRLPLRIGLVQSNLDRLDAYLADVAQPDSPNYSQHWTHAEVAAALLGTPSWRYSPPQAGKPTSSAISTATCESEYDSFLCCKRRRH